MAKAGVQKSQGIEYRKAGVSGGPRARIRQGLSEHATKKLVKKKKLNSGESGDETCPVARSEARTAVPGASPGRPAHLVRYSVPTRGEKGKMKKKMNEEKIKIQNF